MSEPGLTITRTKAAPEAEAAASGAVISFPERVRRARAFVATLEGPSNPDGVQIPEGLTLGSRNPREHVQPDAPPVPFVRVADVPKFLASLRTRLALDPGDRANWKTLASGVALASRLYARLRQDDVQGT